MERLIILIILVVAISSCRQEDEEPKKWVASYNNVLIGDQHNSVDGHFFQPATGNIIKLENTVGIENSLAMIFFTQSEGGLTFLTFPANGENASTFGTAEMKAFTQNPGGINFWPPSDLVSGMLFKPTSFTQEVFDDLFQSPNWNNFNAEFKNHNNNGKDNLEFMPTWMLNLNAGDVLLAQFDGYVRAIICVRNVIPSSINGGSIRLDIIVEGRENWVNNENAKNLQPPVEQ